MIDMNAASLSVRRKIVKTANTRYDGHFGGCLSSVEIMVTLFGGVMNASPDLTDDARRDRFVLSKGHCALGMYAVLNEFGFLSDEELSSFHAEGGDYQTHAVKNPIRGIEISSGSLAMGFSMSCGIATAVLGQGLPSRVFTLVGNGEANEGLFWEAAMFAGSKALANLCVVMDDNRMQNDGDSDSVMPVSNWDERMRSFGWDVSVADGHDVCALLDAFSIEHPDRPLFIHAKTIKGKGLPFMENSPFWHHNKMNQSQYDDAVAILGGV